MFDAYQKRIKCIFIVSKLFHIFIIMQCWLPFEDCMCSRVTPCSLWHGMRFWLYMHPKVLLFLLISCIRFPDAIISFKVHLTNSQKIVGFPSPEQHWKVVMASIWC